MSGILDGAKKNISKDTIIGGLALIVSTGSTYILLSKISAAEKEIEKTSTVLKEVVRGLENFSDSNSTKEIRGEIGNLKTMVNMNSEYISIIKNDIEKIIMKEEQNTEKLQSMEKFLEENFGYEKIRTRRRKKNRNYPRHQDLRKDFSREESRYPSFEKQRQNENPVQERTMDPRKPSHLLGML